MTLPKIITLAAAAILFGSAAASPQADEATARPKPCAGKLEFLTLDSKYAQPREVKIWLPEGYDKSNEPFDVLYMHDGQMLFDATTTWNHQEWQVDEVLTSLISQCKVRPCIVVGIDNTPERIFEYFPNKCRQLLDNTQKALMPDDKFNADSYLAFIVKELKPYVDSHYRVATTPEHTFVAGSSMGGLISLYALCEYPEVFGGAACLSTHLSMALPAQVRGFNSDLWATAFRHYVEKNVPAAVGKHKIYMDHGTETIDAAYGTYQDKLDEALGKLGWNEPIYESITFKGHDHSEASWAKRLDKPMTFLLAK